MNYKFRFAILLLPILTVALLFDGLSAEAQDLNLYQKKEYRFDEGKILPYRILFPQNYDKSKEYPLVLFLHGAGERGKDNEKQLVHGSRLFLRDDIRNNFPAIIVFPQCPEESFWSSVGIDRSKSPILLEFNYDNAITWPLAAVYGLLKQLVKEEGVEKKRVYITGLSMGGMGTFEMAYRFPKTFAAALPICGGGDVLRYDERVKKTAFWVFHGEADAVVHVNESRAMVDKLRSIKADVAYTEYPGVNHNSWDNAFAEPTFVRWMFTHKRKKVKF